MLILESNIWISFMYGTEEEVILYNICKWLIHAPKVTFFESSAELQQMLVNNVQRLLTCII
ncbi:hypothetical protein ACTXT7_002846 [Hymenolepis weldensis]